MYTGANTHICACTLADTHRHMHTPNTHTNETKLNLKGYNLVQGTAL